MVSRSGDGINSTSTSSGGDSAPERPVARPVAVELCPDLIPEELKGIPRWVLWKFVPEVDDDDKTVDWDKPPVNPRTGGLASSTNPATWAPFAETLDAYLRGGWDGMGFVLHKGEQDLVAIDLDKCRDRETGTIEPWARQIIDRVQSYTEASPSGRGVRIFLKGKLPATGRKKGRYENYSTGRYVTVTGNHLAGTPTIIERRQAELEQVHAGIWGKPTEETPRTETNGGGHAYLDDIEVVRRASEARNGTGERFRALWSGSDHGYPSGSEADLALCNYLAFWCGPNPERIDALFRQSGLFRSKWNRDDYRERTINRALAGKTEFFEPGRGGGAKGRARKTTSTRPEPEFVLGPLTLKPGQARKTPTKLTVPVTVVKEGRVVDLLQLSSAPTARKKTESLLAAHLDDSPQAKKGVGPILGQILAHAQESLANAPEREGEPVREILARVAPDALRLRGRTERGLWSETWGGEMTRSDFVTFVNSGLVDAAAEGTDAPRDEDGNPLRMDLLRVIKAEMEVLWADLRMRLPGMAGADLDKDSAAARQFKAQMVRLWTKTQTFEVVKVRPEVGQQGQQGEVAARASLLSRALSQAKDYLDGTAPILGGEGWRPVQSSFAAWWRPCLLNGEEPILLLAMHWELTGQVGVELPGVTDQPSLTALGKRYGVIWKDPPAPNRLSKGKSWLAVLSRDVTEEMSEQPLNSDEKEESNDAG